MILQITPDLKGTGNIKRKLKQRILEWEEKTGSSFVHEGNWRSTGKKMEQEKGYVSRVNDPTDNTRFKGDGKY